jgi:hypothetical protein
MFSQGFMTLVMEGAAMENKVLQGVMSLVLQLAAMDN